MDYKITHDGGEITVWDEAAAVGLRFYEGETMQLYQCAIVLPPWKKLTVRNLEHIERASTEIINYCSQRWPREFAPLNV